MKREYRLRDMIKEGILDIFYIWKDELKNVFKDEGVLIFFFLVPFAYPLLQEELHLLQIHRKADDLHPALQDNIYGAFPLVYTASLL